MTGCSSIPWAGLAGLCRQIVRSCSKSARPCSIARRRPKTIRRLRVLDTGIFAGSISRRSLTGSRGWLGPRSAAERAVLKYGWVNPPFPVAANPARSFSVAELAAHCGLSASRFGHLFREQVHLTPRQFCEKLRLELALQLLSHTGMSVSEVAFKAGFTDPLYFSRRFVRAFGKPPGAARPDAKRSSST